MSSGWEWSSEWAGRNIHPELAWNNIDTRRTEEMGYHCGKQPEGDPPSYQGPGSRFAPEFLEKLRMEAEQKRMNEMCDILDQITAPRRPFILCTLRDLTFTMFGCILTGIIWWLRG